jgi:hypothetical protein
MEIHVEKLKLIQWLAGVTDVAILGELIEFKRSKESDWWDELDSQEKAEIEKGLSDADKGEVISHADFLIKHGKWV